MNLLKQTKIGYLLLGLLCLAFSAGAQNKWKLEKNSDGIRIYTKNVAGSNMKMLRAELEAAGNVQQLANILDDVNRQKTWVYSTKSSRMIKRTAHGEMLYYTEKEMPWPVTNRDVVIKTRMTVDTAAGTLTLYAQNADNVEAAKKGIVRVSSSRVVWKVQELNGNKLKIEYEAQADPGGTVPAWVSNMFLTKGPYESFMALRKQLDKMQ